MFAQAARFAGDAVPAHYDRGLGPHLFVDYAADLAQRTAAAWPGRVLEIAAGTGILTRALRDALPARTALVASDLNPPMLEIARKKFATGENIAFQPADAVALPFADGAFDAVVCQFGVMFFTDKDRAYREAFRVLASGGRCLFSVWDSFDFNSFARVTHETVARFFDRDPPAFFTIPFGYHRIDPIKASLIDAGFDDISVHVLRIDKAIANMRDFAEGLVLGNPIIAEIGARAAAPAAIVAAVAEGLRCAFGGDPGRTTLQAIVFDTRKP
ncbi:MAG TPA: methyltransferase domain-containing protein [Xanthobacteraceae bacterium]|nr:methyltransferase domain-containing protein [Xanthobacteraceae bacterium]